MARVRRGLAQLRQVTDGSNNWPEALATAKEVTSQISSEPDFAAEGRPELAALLPKIAEGLVAKARDELDPALVDQTREALALVEKYVPSSQQPTTRLQDVEATLALAERQIAQGQELNKATAAMLAAVEQGNTQEAYQIRNALLRQYPRLIDNDQLREAVVAVSRAEQAAVKMVSQQTPAETSEPPSAARSVVALAARRGDRPVSGVEGQTVFALAEGAAYGLDASTGEVLWRREIGFASSPSGPAFPPTPIGEEAGSDVLLVDNDRHEVLRVEAATGALRWRHAIGEPLEAHPALTAGRVLVATRSGRIVQIDLESGASPGYAQFQQPLAVAPTVDLARSRMYQVAEHSNLFVLSLDDGKALQTVYLGHEKGSVTAPPVIASRYLVLAENDRAEGGTLRVLSLEAEGDGPPLRLVQEVRLDGYVDTPPLVSGVRVLVVTDKADLRVFEISASKAEAPLAEIAKGKAADSVPLDDAAPPAGMFRFPLIVGSQVWIADSQLSRYDIQPSKGRLEPKGIENEGSVTLQPPVPLGRVVVQVRRKIGLPGVLVSAMPAEGGRAVWETQIAAPLASEPIVDEASGEITAVTQLGAVFRLKTDAVRGRSVVDQPAVALAAAEVRRPLTQTVPLEGNLLALAATGGPKLVPILDLQKADQFRWITLPDALGCPPIGFSAGLLAPCQLGQAVLLDPRSGKPLAEPFQPKLESGVAVDWRAAAAIGTSEAALADGRNKLYRIGIEQQPKPHLAQLGEVSLTESIVSPIAALDGVAYAVDAADSLLAFSLPELTRGQVLPLGGRCVWGPQRVGDHVMLATDEDRLYCLDNQQSLLWKVDLPYGPPAGKPLVSDGGVLFAAAGGVVWRIDPATGQEIAKVETSYPLATGPVPLGDRLLVGGHDGSLYEIDKP
jgi:outer membrane protein assembly factor BamB